MIEAENNIQRIIKVKKETAEVRSTVPYSDDRIEIVLSERKWENLRKAHRNESSGDRKAKKDQVIGRQRNRGLEKAMRRLISAPEGTIKDIIPMAQTLIGDMVLTEGRKITPCLNGNGLCKQATVNGCEYKNLGDKGLVWDTSQRIPVCPKQLGELVVQPRK